MNPLYAMLPDELLIRRVLSGKRHVFEVLVHRYLPGVYAVAYAQTRNHADAEDIVQEAFLKAFMALDTLRDRRRFEGWVVTIARNMAHKLWQKRNREERIAEQLTDMPEPANEDAARRELQALLRQRIEQLPTEQREILLLHYFGGKSTREMAVLLDISRDAVKKRLQRARETLSRDLLDVLGDACAPQRSLTEQGKVIMIVVAAALTPWDQCAAAALASGGLVSSIWTVVLSPATPLIATACVGAVMLVAVLAENKTEELPPVTDMHSPSLKEEVYASMDEERETDGVDDNVQPQADGGNRSVAETTPAHAGKSDKEKKIAPSDIESRLLLPVSIEFEDIHLAEVMEFISDSYDINMIVDQRVLALPTISEAKKWKHPHYAPVMDTTVESCVMPETRLGDVLMRLCEPFGLDYVATPGYQDHTDYIWVSISEEIANDPFPAGSERYAGRDPEAILDAIVPPMAFHDASLLEILNFVADAMKISIVGDHRYIGHDRVRPDALVNVPLEEILRQTTRPGVAGGSGTENIVATGMVHYIKMSHTTLRDAVECLLRPLGLTYSMEDGFVWITGPKLQQRESFRPAPRHFAAQLSKTYQGLFPCDDMDGHPSFAALLAVLETASKVPFFVDNRVISAESPRLYDLTYHHTLPAHSLLNVTTRLCGLDYVALPDRIVVSTPDRLLRSDFPEEYFVPVNTLFTQEGSLQRAFQENNPPEAGV